MRQLAIASVTLIIGLLAPLPASAQMHEQHEPTVEESAEPPPADQGPATSRDGSGTGWLPDSTPVHAIHLSAGGFRWMLHGQFYGLVNWQGTDRGDTEVGSTNWFMAMGSRPLGGGELGLRAMLSLEPLTVGADGYALLGQSGETYQGAPLIDRQHPHDLFMEVAGRYRHHVAGPVSVEAYAGPAGEPAIGPVAFPHRLSAMPVPLAPLGHHWLDSTHLTFGVATLGLATSRAKVEGSWFNGREPDEQRYDMDLRGFDSWAARVSTNPTRDLSLQASYAFLESPEALEPDVSVQRATSSATYNRPLGTTGNWATTLAWGRNVPDGGPTTDAVLIESALETHPLGTFFVRLEQVDKEAADMSIDMPMVEEVRVHGASAGHLHELPAVGDLRPGIGVVANLTHAVTDELAARYGRSFLFGGMVYLTLRPTAAKPMAGMQH